MGEDWPGEREGVHFIGFHNIASAHHLPQGKLARVPVSRHGRGRVNALYCDFHAATIDFSDVNLRSLDDGDLSDWFTRVPEIFPASR